MADLKGLKRICMNCGARFYDLNRKPIVCPGCNAEFTGEIKVKSRRGRLPADDADLPMDDEDVAVATTEDTEIESDEETVSLDEIDEGDEEGDEETLPIEDDDLEINDDLDDLEDDEDVDEDIAEDDDEK